MSTFEKILCTALMIFIFSNSTFKNENLKYKGAATDIKSNVLQYTEEHEEIFANNVHLMTKITYKNKEGVLIASKTLDYSKGFTTPSFIQSDLRNGHQEQVNVSGNKIMISYKESKDKAAKTKTIEMKESFVVDGGFNYFIKNNWTSLSKGEMVKFNFIVPSQLDYYTFRIRKTKEEVVNNKTTIAFVMESDNIIIRSLISPIKLTYDKETHRLMKYEGISNISDNKGGNYVVKITYPTVGP